MKVKKHWNRSTDARSRLERLHIWKWLKFCAVVLMSNTLQLQCRNRFNGGNEKCEMCEEPDVETLEHFLIEFYALEEVRSRTGVEGVPVEEVLCSCVGMRMEAHP